MSDHQENSAAPSLAERKAELLRRARAVKKALEAWDDKALTNYSVTISDAVEVANTKKRGETGLEMIKSICTRGGEGKLQELVQVVNREKGRLSHQLLFKLGWLEDYVYNYSVEKADMFFDEQKTIKFRDVRVIAQRELASREIPE